MTKVSRVLPLGDGWRWRETGQKGVLDENVAGFAVAVAAVEATRERLESGGWTVIVDGPGPVSDAGPDARTVAVKTTMPPVARGEGEQAGSLEATYLPGDGPLQIVGAWDGHQELWQRLATAGIAGRTGTLTIRATDRGGPISNREWLASENGLRAMEIAAGCALGEIDGDPVSVHGSMASFWRNGGPTRPTTSALFDLVTEHLTDAEVAARLEAYGETPAVEVARRGPGKVTDRELLEGFALLRAAHVDVDYYGGARFQGATHAETMDMYRGLDADGVHQVLREFSVTAEAEKAAATGQAAEPVVGSGLPVWALDQHSDVRGHALVDSYVLAAPALYALDETPVAEVPVHAHFYSSNGDWWLTELDAETGEAFGVVKLEGSPPEMGYFSLPEFLALAPGEVPGLPVGVERDLHWNGRQKLGGIGQLAGWGMLADADAAAVDPTDMPSAGPAEVGARTAEQSARPASVEVGSSIADIPVESLLIDPAMGGTVADVVTGPWARANTTIDERRAVLVEAGDPDGLVDVAAAAERADSPALADRITRLSMSRSGIPPTGEKSRAKANIEVLGVLAASRSRELTSDEEVALGAWSGWGACAAIFDERKEGWADLRSEAKALMTADEWKAAQRTSLNAHYTDPRIVSAMAQVVRAGTPDRDLKVLEPGCGSGNFLDPVLWSEDTQLVGVELDPTTAAVAAHAYPSATVRAEGFEKTSLPDETFDAVVGNVPFGRYRLHDPSHNVGKHNIHNHFIIKSLSLTAPGGMVAVITSRFTMDAQNPAARREMHELGDLVAAVRMPEGTHKDAAGTGVATDLLVFRRRGADEARQEFTWEHAARRPDLLSGPVGDPEGVDAPMVNRLWSQTERGEAAKLSPPHPTVRIVGTLGSGSGQYGQADLRVIAPKSSAGPAAVVADTVRALRPTVEAWDFGTAEDRETIDDFRRPVGRAKEGSVDWDGDGFTKVVGGVVTAWQPRNRPDEVKRLIALRGAALDLLEAQAASTSDEALAPLQAKLSMRYDAYVSRFGPVNRFKWSKPRTLKSGEVRTYRVNPQMGGFRADPDWPLVASLENYDDDTKMASKAAIFTKRLLAPRPERPSAEGPSDALAICLDEKAEVDVDRIAELLGISRGEAVDELGELVFFDPADERWVERTAYLSGDVKTKLAQAERAAQSDPTLVRNTEALSEVIPHDLRPEEIVVGFGAPWIDAEVYAQFLADVVEVKVDVRHVPSQGGWVLKAESWAKKTTLAQDVYGTRKRDAIDLAQTKMSGRPVQVRTLVGDGSGKTVVDPVATAEAQEAAQKLVDRWEEWVWEDPERATKIAGTYNELYNRTVLRQFDGSHLTLDGLSTAITPHQHQLDAVWRVVSEPTVLLDHAVGSGKTGEMVMSAMELRRLGRVRQPWIVVPNHMLEQVSREMLEWYPGAKVLVADRAAMKNTATRKEFAARSASGDWDAVVITHSMFERIPVSAAGMRAYTDDITAPLRADLSSASADSDDKTVKQIENQIAKLETAIEERAKTEAADDGLMWEQTGADYLFVDEAHLYKNLATSSSRRELAIEGSNRATDLEMKLHSLRDRFGERVATFATGTPIANSVSEAQVMERFLRPHSLQADGMRAFDSWVTNFAKTVHGMEMSPSGASWRVRERVARFCNVPELVTRFRAFSDVILSDDLKVARPELSGGKPVTVVVERSDIQAQIVAELEERADAVAARRVTPEEDNMLKISNDGRMAALDPRSIGYSAPENGGKLEAIADRVAETWVTNRNNSYTDDAGNPAHRKGALQLVFCDRSTPQADGSWSFYEALRDELEARGLPEGSVRFAQEAANDQAKAQLFADCRSGKVAVLIGSTEKMGVGANIQKRLKALHHADCPWRPADLEQREGRILRQGNENAEVDVVRYATEATFDVFMWQGCERKAGFIDQLRRSTGQNREMDDVGEQALSFAEVKALASGDPMVLEKAEVDGKVEALARSQRAHNDVQARLERSVSDAELRVPRLESLASLAEEMSKGLVSTQGDAFKATFPDGTVERNRIDAGLRIQEDMRAAFGTTGKIPLVEIGGLHLEVESVSFGARVTTEGGLAKREFDTGDIGRGDKSLGVTRRLENLSTDIYELPAAYRVTANQLRADAEKAEGRVGEPFPKQAELDGLRERQREIHDHFEEATKVADPEVDEDGLTSHNEAAVGRNVTGSVHP